MGRGERMDQWSRNGSDTIRRLIRMMETDVLENKCTVVIEACDPRG